MKTNKIRDFVERVGWTAIQAAAAAALVTGFNDWVMTGKIAGTAAIVAALKVVVAQNVGSSGAGDALPGGVEK